MRDPLTPAQRETIGWRERRPALGSLDFPSAWGDRICSTVAGITRALPRVDEEKRPSVALRLLDRTGIGFSS